MRIFVPNHRSLLATLMILFVVATSIHGHADTVGQDVPPPPVIPAQFNQELVQELIDKIDQGQNANILKIGYFLGRRRFSYPAKEGIQLLSKACDQESIGSKRWFVLQMVRGFAGFRVASTTRQIGNQSYDAIFTHLTMAESAKAKDIIQRSVVDYIVTLNDYYGQAFQPDRPSPEIFSKALTACLRYWQEIDKVTPSLNWPEAISRVGGIKPFVPAIEKLLADDKAKDNTVVLRLIAKMYEEEDPRHAIDILHKAKVLLAANEISEAVAISRSLAYCLAAINQYTQAISELKEGVDPKNPEYAWIVALAIKSNNNEEINKIIQILKLKEGKDADINDVASELLALPGENENHEDYAAKAVDLLQNYLGRKQQRLIEEELRARVQVGQYFINKKNYVDAKTVLSNVVPENANSSEIEKYYYASIKRMAEIVKNNP